MVVVCMGVLGMAPTAFAAPHNPTGDYSVFNDCPLNNPEVVTCIYSLTNGGSFTIGAKTVPLVNPVTLQGGLRAGPAGEAIFVGAEDGNTLSKTAQPVPGGLLGITAPSWWPQALKDYFNETVINQGLTGVNATVELARPASEIKLDATQLFAGGTILSLPIKVKLSNAFLGNNCYIGSSSNPIRIDFTTGTTSPPPPNTPITGSPGTVEVAGGGEIVVLSGGRFVNNSFAAPGASGCGGFLFSWAVDPLVNSILGTPAAAGRNTAILEGKLEITASEAVKKSE
jgi:hypothetical protein